MVDLSENKQKLISDFSELSLDDMREKLRAMIEFLDTTKLPALEKVLEVLDTNPRVDADFCIKIYTDIMELIEGIQQIQDQRAQEKLQQIQDKVNQLKTMEAQQDAIDAQEAEAALANI